MKFRKKPIVIDAVKWTGENIDEISEFMDTIIAHSDKKRGYLPDEKALLVKWGIDSYTSNLYIKTKEGEHLASIGDMIIKGVQGEFYPCNPDIFEQSYLSCEEEIVLDIVDEVEESSAQFMNWFVRHYSTAVIEGTLGYVDSMEKPVSSEQILAHYKQVRMAEWGKKVHVQSSMERKKGQFSLFIGRWQPLHDGHKALFQQVLDEDGNVLIGIRDGEVNSKNPYPAIEVMGNIMNHYEQEIKDGRVKVFILPDICSVEFGRGVGYDIIERIPPAEIGQISATKIREAKTLNDEKI